ncbi:hypothetical protein BCR36DRAFT_375732 [Piromyces finnis]|uniref:Uncharacterized protein n=1 Tax=Piromyces finnis TaxID=1754191 RepID=A0A1Y1UG38_9FUNG|nr:hypothetical protein BCR36DRAFT_375732 [Piromyces finnis]|eukprot:ORX36982.1 hypothetical protein BCR36DRAFT_375732 [Piromyces finnis]
MIQNSIEKEIENLILSNNSLNNKVDEITSELQNTQKENRLIYNIIGKLRIKNKLLCKKLKEIIIKKNITLGELEMDKKLDNNDEDEEEKDILKSYDGKNIEKSLLLKEIDKINTEIENTNSEILCCLTNIKEKKKWNNSKIFDKSIINNVDYSLIRDNEDESNLKNKSTEFQKDYEQEINKLRNIVIQEKKQKKYYSYILI